MVYKYLDTSTIHIFILHYISIIIDIQDTYIKSYIYIDYIHIDTLKLKWFDMMLIVAWWESIEIVHSVKNCNLQIFRWSNLILVTETDFHIIELLVGPINLKNLRFTNHRIVSLAY